MIAAISRTTYTFADYLALTAQLVAEGRTTGPIQTPDYLQRMQRLVKTTTIKPELQAAVQSLPSRYKWQVITEPWCGDAAQNVPVIALLAALNPNITLELILRDDNLDLMDQHLTNGGRSIPKLIITDLVQDTIIGSWGPRPSGAQDMVMAYKALAVKPPYSEFVVDVQKWYAHDKTQSCQAELLALLQGLPA
jgi:hypothetical protein